MSTFLLTHHFPKDFQTSPETRAAATAWFEGLGAKLTGGGNAVEPRRLGDCGPDPERRVAYTLISAGDLAAALAVAEAWPPLARGGGVEVRELPVLQASVPASARS
jgi:hypothetical protein